MGYRLCLNTQHSICAQVYRGESLLLTHLVCVRARV